VLRITNIYEIVCLTASIEYSSILNSRNIVQQLFNVGNSYSQHKSFLTYSALQKCIYIFLNHIFFRLEPKYIKITVNKEIQNLEYSHNDSLTVYHQKSRGLSKKTDKLLIPVIDEHSCYILC
jgi:hypothetical protein